MHFDFVGCSYWLRVCGGNVVVRILLLGLCCFEVVLLVDLLVVWITCFGTICELVADLRLGWVAVELFILT